MIIHSIIPSNIIFGEEQSIAFEEIEYKGNKIIAQNVGKNAYKVERIISTDLKSFLDNSISPGNIIFINL